MSNTNEQTLEDLNRDFINEQLTVYGSVRFTYEKADGTTSVRTAINPPVAELEKIKGETESNEDVIVLWSATDNAWRSFRLDGIREFH